MGGREKGGIERIVPHRRCLLGWRGDLLGRLALHNRRSLLGWRGDLGSLLLLGKVGCGGVSGGVSSCLHGVGTEGKENVLCFRVYVVPFANPWKCCVFFLAVKTGI